METTGLRILGGNSLKWGRRHSTDGLFKRCPKVTCPGVLHPRRSTKHIPMATNGIHVISTRTRKRTANMDLPRPRNQYRLLEVRKHIRFNSEFFPTGSSSMDPPQTPITGPVSLLHS